MTKTEGKNFIALNIKLGTTGSDKDYALKNLQDLSHKLSLSVWCSAKHLLKDILTSNIATDKEKDVAINNYEIYVESCKSLNILSDLLDCFDWTAKKSIKYKENQEGTV